MITATARDSLMDFLASSFINACGNLRRSNERCQCGNLLIPARSRPEGLQLRRPLSPGSDLLKVAALGLDSKDAAIGLEPDGAVLVRPEHGKARVCEQRGR